MVVSVGRWAAALLFGLTLLFLSATVSQAQEINLQDGEFSAFDLYVGGKESGAIFGYFGPDWFEPASSEDVITLLTAVKSPDTFLPLFQGRIEKIRTVRGIGTIRVDSAKFRLDLDIAQEQARTTAVDALETLDSENNSIAVRNTTFIAGSADTQTFDIFDGTSLTHKTVISKGRTALTSAGTFTRRDTYDLQTAEVRHDFKARGQDLTGYAGLLQAGGGMRFARSLDYMGFRLATNQDLLFRDQQLQGSAIEVFLPRRAQIKIFRESEASGHVLYYRAHDFGTLEIDTRSFPQGSYDIEIVTYDGNTVLSRETRPFIKNQNLPPRGKPIISLDIGQIREDTRMQDKAVVQVAARARLTDTLGGGIGIAATSKDQVYEASLNAQKAFPVFKTMGLVETSMTGAYAKDGLAGLEASVRWSSEKAAVGLIGSKTYFRTATGSDEFALSDRQAVNFHFSMPFEIWNKRFFYNFSAETSRTSGGGSAYRFGPALSHNLEKVGGYTPEVKLEYNKSKTDNRILGTLILRNNTSAWTRDARLDISRIGADKSMSALFALGFNGNNDDFEGWRKKLQASLGLRMDPLRSSTRDAESIMSAQAQYTGNIARVSASVEQSLKQNGGQAGGELESTVIWSANSGLRTTGRSAGADTALLMVTLNGDDNAQFNIVLNNSVRDEIRTGETVVLPIPIYERVTVNIADNGSDHTMKIKEGMQTVVGYPGNVISRVFTAARSWIMAGTLVGSDGKPLVDARFMLGNSVYYTDGSGFFTIEETAQSGEEMNVVGYTFNCTFIVPKDEAGDSILLDLGNVTCQEKP